MILTAGQHFRPPPKVASRDWLPRHVTMPAGTETAGLPFSLDDFPHVGGVLDAFDDPSIREIVLQWGTRLGKTTTCLSLMAKVAATRPRNMMFASSTGKSAARVVKSRIYPLLENTRGLAEQLKSPSQRSQLEIVLRDCRIFVGWSGSDTSLADVGAWFGIANEIDKWDTAISEEADPLQLFLNRMKGFSDHKVIVESTPRIKGRSRIETRMRLTQQRRRWCPCPHCGEYQILVKGDKTSAGGIKWTQTAEGRNDPDLAFLSAYYRCEHCAGQIENHHRLLLLRAGVWCPDGCHVTRDGEIAGTPSKPLADAVGFGPLPSWYAPTEKWGHFARSWLRAQKRPRELQDLFNSYMAECWEIGRAVSTPERLAARLGTDLPAGVCPLWALFVTVSIDRQAAEGGFLKYTVLAHGPGEQAAIVDYGRFATLAEVHSEVIRRAYPHADGGLPLTAVVSCVDSGHQTKDTYDFCAAHPGVLACKGSGQDLGGAPYKLVVLGTGESRRLRTGSAGHGQELLHIATDFWETELQNRFDLKLPGEEGSLSLCQRAARDPELLDELLNSVLTDDPDSRGNPKLQWRKRLDHDPNDYRDALRYGLCLARAWLDARGGAYPPRSPPARILADPHAPGPHVRTPTEKTDSGGWIRRRT